MKSLGEFYKEIKDNEELKKEFISAFKEGRTEEFLKSYECDASASDVNDFFKSAKADSLSEDDLAKVSAGGCSSFTCGDTCGCYTAQFPYC